MGKEQDDVHTQRLAGPVENKMHASSVDWTIDRTVEPLMASCSPPTQRASAGASSPTAASALTLGHPSASLPLAAPAPPPRPPRRWLYNGNASHLDRHLPYRFRHRAIEWQALEQYDRWMRGEKVKEVDKNAEENAAEWGGPEDEPWYAEDPPSERRGILNAILHHPRDTYVDYYMDKYANFIDVHKPAKGQLAAFAERGWPAGHLPTTREIARSMLARRAAELELDIESKRQAGQETVYSYTVHAQDRITPVREPAAAADGESGNEDLIDGGEQENDYDGVGDGESFL